MTVQQSKYLYITREKEQGDILKLIDLIKNDQWIDCETVIVNCNPYYSSRMVQEVNHRLSYLNRNELYECINIEMPLVGMNQIWNSETREYENFDYYLKVWLNKYITKNYKYLFLNSGIIDRNLNKIKLSLREVDYKIGSLYIQEDSIFVPNYYVQKFSEGKLLYNWENSN